MKKKIVADNVIKLLKQGYSPKEVTERMAVSYNYAWKLKKDLEKAAGELKTTILSVNKTVYPEAGEFAQADTSVDAILNTRATTYGSFVDVAEVAQEFKNIAYDSLKAHQKTIYADQAEALDMIFSKIARIVHGNPNYVDSWVDIAGYAQLVADRLQGKIR